MRCHFDAYQKLAEQRAEEIAQLRAELERMTLDRDAKSKRMWELGKEADSAESRLREAQGERLYLDCEWNDWQGALISMALVGEDGREWYEVVGCGDPSPWVAENVMPKLDKEWISPHELRESLRRFLSQYQRVQIIADWPEDIAYFCNTIVMPGGMRIATPDLHFHCWRGLDGQSYLPHNALADARGIMRAARAAEVEKKG